MSSLNQKNIDFVRLALRDQVTRPQMAIALYPESVSDNTISVTVNTSDQIVLSYVGSTTETLTVDYIRKSVQDVVDEINRSSLPIDAVSLTRGIYLQSGDLVNTGGSNAAHIIPHEYPVVDRVPNNGVVLRLARYTVKHKRSTRIGVLPPYEEDSTLPWHPRVTVGSFSQKFKGQVFHFGVPEYKDQVWSLRYGAPFKDATGAVPRPLGSNAFKLARRPIYWNGENILVYNDDIPLSTTVIRDVDTHNGIVYLNQDVNIGDGMTVDYTYLEEDYEYNYINLNGHFTQNPNLIDKFVVVYIRPMESVISTARKRTIYHVVADSIPAAIDQIEMEDEDVPVAVIGAYSVQQIFSSDRAVILDTRSKGGGLRHPDGPVSPVHDLHRTLEPTDGESIEDTFNEGRNFWDIGNYDGEPYPGAAAVVVDLPDTLREVLPITDIKAKARKFLAAGVFPVFNLSDRELPAITGASSQIAAAYNLDFSGEYSNQSGLFWTPSTYELPENTVLTGWPASFNINVPIQQVDGRAVLETNNGTGYFQSYLKSSPWAAIRWDERDVLYDSGNPQSTQTTTWVTKTVVDDREVPDGQLLKGYVVFNSDLGPKQIKNVQVHAPYRLDNTGDIAKQLIEGIMHGHHGQNEQLFSAGLVNVQKKITDIGQNTTVTEDEYYGLHPRYRTYMPIAESTISGSLVTLQGLFTAEMSTVSAPDVPFFRSYNPAASTHVLTKSKDRVNVGTQVEFLTHLARFNMRMHGTGHEDYTGMLGNLKVVWNNILDANDPSYPYWPAEYSVDPVGVHTPIKPKLSVNLADVDPSSSEDHKLMDMLPPLYSVLTAVDDYTSGNLDSLSGMFSGLHDSFMSGFSRLPSSITATPTIGIHEVADHWYTRHDRLGEYAGTFCKQATQVYDYLYSGLSGTQLQDENYSGANSGALDDFYTGAALILSSAVSPLQETYEKGGVLDPHLHRLFYGYAWYVRTAMERSKFTPPGDVGESLALPDEQFVSGVAAQYYGILMTGMNVLVKGMVTTEGEIYNTSVVDQAPGPFPATVPSEILETLAKAATIDDTLLPLTQAVYNTITGRYDYKGLYPQDPRTTATPADDGEVLYRFSKAFDTIALNYPAPNLSGIDRSTIAQMKYIE